VTTDLESRGWRAGAAFLPDIKSKGIFRVFCKGIVFSKTTHPSESFLAQQRSHQFQKSRSWTGLCNFVLTERGGSGKKERKRIWLYKTRVGICGHSVQPNPPVMKKEMQLDAVFGLGCGIPNKNKKVMEEQLQCKWSHAKQRGSVKWKESKRWNKFYILHSLRFKLWCSAYQLIVFPQVLFCHCSLSVRPHDTELDC